MSDAPVQLRVVSFGYGHNEPVPPADIVVDVRRWFRDPADTELRELNGHNELVITKVWTTPGVARFVHGLYGVAQGLLELGTGLVTVAIGCAGGRHRSVVIASAVADKANLDGYTVVVADLHVDRPVIQREGKS